jgi:hypothetical protein
MNKKITILIILILFFIILNFSKISFAQTECITSNPSISISPSNQSGNAGSTLVYTIYMKNNDNAPCNSTDFELSCDANINLNCSLVSSGGIETPHMIEGNIPPGFEWSRTVKVTSSSNLSAGSYSFIIVIDDGVNKSVTKSASVIGYYNVQGQTVTTTEYKNMSVGETFTIELAADNPYKWQVNLDDYDSNYFQHMGGVGCSPTGHCTYSFQFKALKSGETIIYVRKINTIDNAILEIKKIYVTIKSTTTCTDSDGGKNYYTKGCMNNGVCDQCGLRNSDGTLTNKYYCKGESNCVLFEVFCTSSGQYGSYWSEDYKCPYGCQDGACLPEPIISCSNHAQCSQACDNLGIDFHWMGTGSSYKSWTGTCPSNVYGCMTGQCCIGQCKYTTTKTCFCQQTNKVDIYGDVCPAGTTCGSDCYCHPIEKKIAYLNQPFDLKEKESVEIVDYKNMIVTLDKLEFVSKCLVASQENSSVTMPCIGTWIATVSMRIPGDLTSISMLINLGEMKDGPSNTKIKFDSLSGSGTDSTARFIVSLKTEDFYFNVKTDKYSYYPGESVRITAVLSGNPSINFKDAKVVTTVIDPNGRKYDVEMKEVGIAASTCTQSMTTGTYTCAIINQYQFVGFYNVPSDGSRGSYEVISTAFIGMLNKNAETKFVVEQTYSDYVDISIDPKEQLTYIGKEVSYDVTIFDKHPAVCVAETRPIEGTEVTPIPCEFHIYNYLIDVDGLPYHTVFPNIVSVPAGGSKTFELKIFPSSVKTAEGITTAQQITTTTTTAERSVSITGKSVATEETKNIGEFAVAPSSAALKEATFRFAVKASLKEEIDTSDTVIGVLRVRYVEEPEPPPFPETEKIEIELRGGWNLISVPGKGLGFTQGTCSANQKPVAFVYLQEQQRYVSFEEALNIMGKDEFLEYLSTHSFWIYSYEECSIGFKFKSYSTYSGLSLVQGWNLLGTTKDMIGETLNNIKGTCSFEKIYTWDSDSQKWIEKSENDLIEKMGYGTLVKAVGACNLKTNLIQPPQFPGG